MLNQIKNITASLPIQIAVYNPKEKQQSESVIEVFCDLCSQEAHGTRRQLTESGWGIYQREAFCPIHEEMV